MYICKEPLNVNNCLRKNLPIAVAINLASITTVLLKFNKFCKKTRLQLQEDSESNL